MAPLKFPYTLIELTHTLDESSPSWEDNCGFSSSIVFDYADCTSETRFRVQHFTMPAGIGTHMDAPSHCCPDGLSIDQIPLDQLVAPCVAIDVSPKVAACYGPEDILMTTKKLTPSFFHTFNITVSAIYP